MDTNKDTNENGNIGSNIIPDALLHTYEDADAYAGAFTYCNADAKFHRDPCAKLYIDARSKSYLHVDHDSKPDANPHADQDTNHDIHTNGNPAGMGDGRHP